MCVRRMSTRLATFAKASVSAIRDCVVNGRGFNKMASRAGGTKQKRTLLDFDFIKKKKMREDEENEQDDGQQGKH